ncbi:SCP2 sterol-binding domain-containing protein [Fervidibacillus halotolerans]|uniref:SCP2 sterol-binding domain-containing protein n=1 Tax=Fervidibacillus halotolerans TaxID=2980027 RepID=A0A9E8LYT6_9BACI|nr:SCP2 sterol-binding domain-containing protein [Fervidibacillus halotolerans]WAA12235.1 SCP2 sterol-binding domain-containing protein [Fervidibacillus halotolerans]
MNLENMSMKDLWITISKTLNDNPKPFSDLKGVYQFELQGKEQTEIYQLSFENGVAKWSEGVERRADVVLEMKESDFPSFLTGKLKGMTAYMTGKLKIKGNISLAMKLESLLKQYSL